MAYTMEDFQKDYVRDHLGVLSPDEILEQFSADDHLKGHSPDEILEQFSADDRLKGLSPDEILKRISLEEIQRYLEKQKKTETNHNKIEGIKKH